MCVPLRAMSLESWDALPRFRLRASANPAVARLIDCASIGGEARIVYFAGSTPGVARWVRPIQVFSAGRYGGIYLEAYCESRRATRCFRVDKLELLDVGASRVTPVSTPVGVRTARAEGRWFLWAILVGTTALVSMCVR